MAHDVIETPLRTNGSALRANTAPLRTIEQTPVTLEQAMLQLNPVIEMTYLDRERIGQELPVHFSKSHARYVDLHRDLGFEATKEIADVRRLLQTLQQGLGQVG